MAEALGQTAIHPPWLDTFFFDAEKMAAQSQEPSKPLVAILDEIRNDKKLSTAAHWDDQNQIRDGVLVRARAEIVKYASNWRVDPKDLEEARAEMVNAAGMSPLSFIEFLPRGSPLPFGASHLEGVVILGHQNSALSKIAHDYTVDLRILNH